VSPTQKVGPRGERTRVRILEAATDLFAESGYSDTRLEDIASRVGVQRAALAYYFRSKQELYDVVLGEAAGDLVDRAREALELEAPLEERLERMVDLWLEAVRQRPWLIRLLLRQVAGASPTGQPPFAPHGRRLIRLLEELLKEAPGPTRIDALHLVSLVAGTTSFFVSGAPVIAPRKPFDPLAPRNLARHRAQLLATIHRLLGIEEPRGRGARVATRSRRRSPRPATR
jgi:AcrR family transcriptional regulator